MGNLPYVITVHTPEHVVPVQIPGGVWSLWEFDTYFRAIHLIDQNYEWYRMRENLRIRMHMNEYLQNVEELYLVFV